MNVAEKITYKGQEINICYDESADSPRVEDNVGTMVCWHRSYNLGDEKPRGDYEDWLLQMSEQILGETDEAEKLSKQEQLDLIEKNAVILPLWLYDHSGISMRTCPHGQHASWDCGRVGFIYVMHSQIRKEYSVTEITPELLEKVEKILEGEVETYSDYLEGNVYGYKTENDSCWGYFGNSGLKQAIADAKEYIDWEIADKLKKHLGKLKAQLKNKVPLEKREVYTNG